MKAAIVLLVLPALLAGCLAGEPSAPPSGPTGQIDGAVVDHLLRPFGNQTVTLVQLERTDQSSPRGGFTFRDVPAGFYTLSTRLADGATATEVVDVEPGRITRVILQVLPLPVDLPRFEAFPFTSPGEAAQGGAVCKACEWAVPLGAERPHEVTFEAVWDAGLLLGGERDHLDILVTDGRGFPLFDRQDLASPVYVSLDGADIHPDASEIRIQVRYGRDFLPSPQEFTMHSVITNYYGGTKADLFQV